MTEFYQWIFSEASRAVFIPGIRELTFPAMQLFGGYDVALPLAVAMLAAGIGAMPVWLLGRVMGKLRTLRPESLPEEKFQLISAKARQFGWLALPFYALLPMGSLLILIDANRTCRPHWSWRSVDSVAWPLHLPAGMHTCYWQRLLPLPGALSMFRGCVVMTGW